jgi:hypothetical protein
MEANIDADTTRKLEMINKKVDEINQRRFGLRTTGIEDELDRQELDEYIGTLNLTREQKNLLDGFSRDNEKAVHNRTALYYGMMIVSVFIEAYLGYSIAEILMNPGTALTGLDSVLNSLYLFFMIGVFIVNAFYILRFMRILR